MSSNVCEELEVYYPMSNSQPLDKGRNSPADLNYRRFYRACLALFIIVAPIILFLGFAVDPTGGLGVPANLNGVAASINSAIAHSRSNCFST